MTLGIIGCGKMGSALLGGALSQGAISHDSVLVGAPDRASSQDFAKAHNLTLADDSTLMEQADAILLCVKPYQIDSVLSSLFHERAPKLIISVAAGMTLDSIASATGHPDCPVIRCMPNTPSLVGCGASGYAASESTTSEQIEFADALLSSVGIAERVPENLINAVTGVSGSGPAYIYLIIEALADGGVKNGLPRETALHLATQTVLGAAKMVSETGLHPATLKDQVTSPGGTTIAALATLEKHGVRHALIDAVTAARARAEELA